MCEKKQIMKIDFEKFSKAFSDKPEADIVRKVAQYGELKKKLNSPDAQSWYFRNSLPEKQRQLEDMRKEFNEIRRIFNTQTIDDFLAELKRPTALKKKLDSKPMNMPQRPAYPKIISDINFFNELLYIKKMQLS
jgi:hypothetical protein